MISWLSTATAEGVLYPVDVRLRREGKAGSIATSLDRLETYFKHDAWIWEKLALSKARCIAGDACLAQKLEASIQKTVNQPHDQSKIGPALESMLFRIRESRNANSEWHLRARDGGLIDLGLLIQAMRLQHGDLFSNTGQSPKDILETLFSSGKISEPQFSELQVANNLFDELHQCICLTFGNAAALKVDLPTPFKKFVLTQMDLADSRQLNILLNESIYQVQKQIDDYLMINTDRSA